VFLFGSYYCVTLFDGHLILSLICGLFAVGAVISAAILTILAYSGKQRIGSKLVDPKPTVTIVSQDRVSPSDDSQRQAAVDVQSDIKVKRQENPLPTWIGILLCVWFVAQIVASIGFYKMGAFDNISNDNINEVAGCLFLCAEGISALIIAIGCYATFKRKLKDAMVLIAIPALHGQI
jgi:Na+/melibiose symporter-like transporter